MNEILHSEILKQPPPWQGSSIPLKTVPSQVLGPGFLGGPNENVNNIMMAGEKKSGQSYLVTSKLNLDGQC